MIRGTRSAYLQQQQADGRFFDIQRDHVSLVNNAALHEPAAPCYFQYQLHKVQLEKESIPAAISMILQRPPALILKES